MKLIFLAIVKYVKETLETESFGKCYDFQTVPGCGLKCMISNTSSIEEKANKTARMINYENQVRYLNWNVLSNFYIRYINLLWIF